MSLNLGIIASSRNSAPGITDATAIYSLRKLRSAYTGSAIRVRRSSDNTEQDIGFVSGNFDTASLASFAGYQNLSLWSEDYSNVYWTKNGGSVTVNSALAPDGNSTANKFTETSGNEVHRIYQQPGFTTGYVYTYSVYLKYIARRYVMLELSNSSGMQVIFDIQNGVVASSVGAVPAISSAIQSVGNGWYRCSVTFQNPSGTTLIISGNNSGTAAALVYAGLGGDAFYVWGSQMNVGYIAQAYQKTTSAANIQYITKWYDQSGNGLDAIQATTANQPQILLNPDTGVSSAVWHGGSNYLTTSSNYTFGTSVSTFWVGLRTNGLAAGCFFGDSNTNFDCRAELCQIQNPNFYVGAFGSSFSVWALGSLLRITGSSKAYINNIQSSTTNSSLLSSVGTRTISIGKRGLDNTINLQGWNREIIIYNSNQTVNLSTINLSINSYYSIYTPQWQGSGTALLDLYSSAATAYSLRNLSSTYLGPLIKVRRSLDNEEIDIYGNLLGNLDTVGLLKFVGSGNGFVTTWYDQSGNGRNAIQATTANQPIIVLSGSIYYINNKPAALFNGTTNELKTSSTATWLSSTPYSIYVVDRVNTIKSDNYFAGTASTLGIVDKALIAGYRSSTQVTLSQFGDDGNFSFTQVQQQKLHDIYFKNPNSEYFINNVSLGTQSNPANSLNITDGGFQIGRAYGNGALYYNGYIQEIFTYSSNQFSNRAAIASNINSYYTIY